MGSDTKGGEECLFDAERADLIDLLVSEAVGDSNTGVSADRLREAINKVRWLKGANASTESALAVMRAKLDASGQVVRTFEKIIVRAMRGDV